MSARLARLSDLASSNARWASGRCSALIGDGGCWASNTMKAIITLLFSCASIWAAETELRVASTAGTNVESAVAWTRDVFTRDGQTNLVRTTKVTPRGVTQVAHFYHAGQLVGNFLSMEADPESPTFNTETGPYCMSLNFWSSGAIRSAQIGDKSGVLLDEFTYTNGVFSPAERAIIERERAKGKHMKPKFAPGS